MNKFYIRTFGCQMNDYDSLVVGEMLEGVGYVAAREMGDADLVLFNTCAVRELAEHKALSELGRVRKLKEKKPELKVGILGCVAQKLGDGILKKYGFVDFVLGTKDMYRLPEFLKGKETKVVGTDLTYMLKGYSSKKTNNISAYVTVIRGCTNFCSYCIVPYVRGTEESRGIDEIIAEVRTLVDNGAREITLLGQNVNAYGMDTNTRLENLLKDLNKIDSLLRLRYVTSHPKSVTREFIETVSKLDKVCEHIHVPFQSGSNKILKSMNRKYSREEYIEKINTIRSIIPQMAVTADVIVGYPNETEKDFNDTLDLLKECSLDNIYSFKYSPREGTLIAKTEDNILKAEKERRLAKVHKLVQEISEKKNKELIGSVQEVLWEGEKNFRGKDLLMGRTRTFRSVFVSFSKGRLGKVDNVKITKATINALKGSII